MLDFHFGILKYTGVWCPIDWCRNWKFHLYTKFYTVIVITSIYVLNFWQMTPFVHIRNFADFNDTFYISLANTSACFKATCYILRRGEIINFLEMFKNDLCTARDDKERDILKKNESKCRKIAMSLLSAVYITVMVFFAVPLYKSSVDNRVLPYKVLLPYDLRDPLNYWLTFSFHTFVALILISVTMTTDALIASCMVQICAQLELLQHRLDNLPKKIAREEERSGCDRRKAERNSLRGLVEHHVHIFRIAEAVTKTFKWVIIWQNYVIAVQICICVYQLTFRSTYVVEILLLPLFILCILGEFFVYCYYGNQVSVESENVTSAIWKSDWTSLPLRLRRELTFLMHRSLKPIRISCGHLMRLDLKSFVKVINLSYSAYNVLKSSPST